MMVLAAGLMVYLCMPVWTSPYFDLHMLMGTTYKFRRVRGTMVLPWSTAQQAFEAWTVLLSFAYAMHWMQVQLHAADIRRFVDHFNAIIVAEGLQPVRPGGSAWGFIRRGSSARS